MGGKLDELQGRAKQAAGNLKDDDSLRNEGKADETAGKTKEKVDDVVDSVRDKFTH